MNSVSSRLSCALLSSYFRFSLALGVALPAVLTTGCGGGGGGTGTTASGSTSVTVLSSSTANNQLSTFDMVLNTVTLTGESGKTVSLIATPLHAEFMHVNGAAEPLLAVTIPQDVYSSATASIGVSRFGCVNLNPSTGGIEVSDFAYGYTPASNVTVNLPAPITITGTSMGLSLDLLVSKSASFTTCDPSGIEPFSITPTFNLAPMTLSSTPTNSENGKESGLKGLVASVDASGGSFTVTAGDGPSCVSTAIGSCVPAAANGPTWQVTSNGATAYEGITGVSQLVAGMPVDMDAAIQPDGSLLATRIAVYDTDAAKLTVSTGPLLFVSGAGPSLTTLGVEQHGPLSAANAANFDFDNVVFQSSGQLTNVQSLPFGANFGASNMVAGQNIFVSTHAQNVSGSFPYTQATAVTLLPQTINGTVSAISTSGSFTTYTVALAAYDLFPTLAVQPGQTTLLSNPGTVIVYADSTTQMLNTDPVAVGSVMRFYGLVFNDNGTLRMDCAQVNDGVAE